MRALPLLVLAALTLAACDATGPDASTADVVLTADASATTALGPDLATVRQATARYHRVKRAVADGWGDPAISPCVSDPELGGMGYHYLNLEYLLDGGTLNPTTPEALLYEPQKNGRLRLVGVEYIVPFDFVPTAAEGGTAPELFGQTFHESEGAGGWALHVWVWRHNPAGMFADFNPNVSCEYAPTLDA
jgi:hypothetical protein